MKEQDKRMIVVLVLEIVFLSESGKNSRGTTSEASKVADILRQKVDCRAVVDYHGLGFVEDDVI
jgi:hypothetical protein